MIIRNLQIFFAGLLVWLTASMALAADAPKVGDMAPDFELQASDGNTYRLADYRGEKAVVLAWFPKAYTRGCTIECKSLAENGHLIRQYAVDYFMASVDSVEDNAGFAAEQNADFPLLSDPTQETASAYGVLNPAGYANRHTYYIGKDGRILAIDRNVRPETSAEDMAATLGELGVARR
ncbi:MAG: peroxiredoxin [Gammaproteobacteria bacterium]|nr:peroxiredoxin [Gammaproteobacteria bacterium]